jgi:hypothetical protein
MAALGLLDAWLALMRWFWTAQVNALERHLDHWPQSKTNEAATRRKKNMRRR